MAEPTSVNPQITDAVEPAKTPDPEKAPAAPREVEETGSEDEA